MVCKGFVAKDPNRSFEEWQVGIKRQHHRRLVGEAQTLAPRLAPDLTSLRMGQYFCCMGQRHFGGGGSGGAGTKLWHRIIGVYMGLLASSGPAPGPVHKLCP